MAVPDKLPCLVSGSRKSHSVHHVIQPAFKQHQEINTRNSFLPLGTIIISSELLLENAVDPLYFLFFAELQTIVRKLASAPLAMLARRIGTPFKRALVPETTIAFQKKLQVFSTA
jgi:hypothetical protein